MYWRTRSPTMHKLPTSGYMASVGSLADLFEPQWRRLLPNKRHHLLPHKSPCSPLTHAKFEYYLLN